MVDFKVHPLWLHTTFPAFVALPEHSLWDGGLRTVLQPTGCLLLTQNGVLSLPIILFEIERSLKVRDQWLKRLRHHRNAFGCQKLRSTANPAVALWVPRATSWHKFFSTPILQSGDRGGKVVKVLCYKSVGPWFDSRWCHWNFSLT